MHPVLEALKKSKVYSLNQHLFVEEKKVRKPRKPTKEVQWVENELREWCERKGYTLMPEFRFHPARKYRFDWAIITALCMYIFVPMRVFSI